MMLSTCTEVLLDTGRSRGVAEKSKVWKPGTVLQVRFMGGESWMHSYVINAIREWQKYAKIDIRFDNHPSAQIKISFDPNRGHQSMIGTDALYISQFEPTMNLAFVRGGNAADYFSLALHEFGHALGLVHEHQNPAQPIAWNEDAAYEYYNRTQGWGREQIYTNIISRYAVDAIQGTSLDPQSIMMYAIPRELTQDGFSVGWNKELSATDKMFIARLYPGLSVAPPPVVSVKLAVGKQVRALTGVNVRRTPGYVRKPMGDVLAALKVGQIAMLTEGYKLKDGLRWWLIASEGHSGWVAQNAPNGTALLAAM